MAVYSRVIGRPTQSQSDGLWWNPPNMPDRLVPPIFVAGGATSYLRYVNVLDDRMALRFHTADSTSGGTAGPDLRPAVENRMVAHYAVSAPGLSVSPEDFAAALDATDPYTWRATGGAHAALTAFITAYRNLTQAQQDQTTVTWSDGAGEGVAAVNWSMAPAAAGRAGAQGAGSVSWSLSPAARAVMPALMTGSAGVPRGTIYVPPPAPPVGLASPELVAAREQLGEARSLLAQAAQEALFGRRDDA